MSVKKEGVKPCDCQEEQIETGIGMFPNGIKYCPLHASAPMLYEACRTVLESLNGIGDPMSDNDRRDVLIKAIAYVEGRES